VAAYTGLPITARLVFRRIGLFPGPEVNPEMAAELAGVSLAEAGDCLRVLGRRDLVDEVADDRYRLQGMLRSYAAERCGVEDDETERRAAALRFVHLLLSRLKAAVASLSTNPAVRTCDEHQAFFNCPQDAARWLEAERMTLIVAVAWASALGLHQHSWEMVRCLGIVHSGH
jgi:hypothetical protein